jgi:ubiquinone/menaquinone biosynthesis C-methylase UbiE
MEPEVKNQPEGQEQTHPFDENYFKTAAYAEVSFARFSQYWWSNRFYAKLARRYGPRQGRVLEIGCGLGHLLQWLTDLYQVCGADINSFAIGEAKQNVPEGEFSVLSAENLSQFEDQSFQIVIAKHVVEHLQDPEKAISEMSRVLAPGGLLILATQNLDSYMCGIKKERWIGYKDPTHISLKPPADWLAFLRKHNFRIKKAFSDGFWDAPYVSMIPAKIQKILFGAPGGLQAILGWSIIPVRMGESLIILAYRL